MPARARGGHISSWDGGPRKNTVGARGCEKPTAIRLGAGTSEKRLDHCRKIVRLREGISICGIEGRTEKKAVGGRGVFKNISSWSLRLESTISTFFGVYALAHAEKNVTGGGRSLAAP